MFRSSGSFRLPAALKVLAAVFLLSFAAAAPALAAADNPSGLPVPRFASTRSNPVNIRVGPGTNYDISWVYVKAGLPVEVIAEFDVWRKIRDVDGAVGWVHQNLLVGNRSGYVTPWADKGQVALRASAAEDAAIRAYLPSGFKVDISSCDGQWCAVRATDHPGSGRPATYSGYLPQSDLWGVYKGEMFD